MAKVVRGGNMFFEDDIKIIDSELSVPLNLPNPPVFLRDELQILYNGHVYAMTRDFSDNEKIKIYTKVFGLKEIDSPKLQEDKYFSDNSVLVNNLKKDFIERVVDGISDLDIDLPKIKASAHIGPEIVDRIHDSYSKLTKPNKQKFSGKGLISKLDDGSVFNSEMQGCERVLILDKKIYDLLTIPEYISIFQDSFDATFYKKLEKESQDLTPQQISEMILNNKDKVHIKVLPGVRNKIWHSDKSWELCLDGTYWIPQFRASYDDSVKLYRSLLEKQLKIDAARSIKW